MNQPFSILSMRALVSPRTDLLPLSLTHHGFAGSFIPRFAVTTSDRDCHNTLGTLQDVVAATLRPVALNPSASAGIFGNGAHPVVTMAGDEDDDTDDADDVDDEDFDEEEDDDFEDIEEDLDEEDLAELEEEFEDEEFDEEDFDDDDDEFDEDFEEESGAEDDDF